VNEGAQLLDGRADAVTGLRIAANYAIPYVVASVGYLSGQRNPRATGEDELT
jgi:hypothetical protein